MERMKIKTEHRKVKQTVRSFTDAQRKMIISQIDNRPSNVTKSQMFQRMGMGKTGSLYYTWKEKFNSSNVPMDKKENVKSEVKMTEPMNIIKVKRVMVEVDINSLEVLMETINEINKVKGVKSVSA